MGKLFYIMGKSSSGKDTVFKELLLKKELKLCPLVPYTTRPIRDNEVEGNEYHFVTEERLHELEKLGKVIELRCYQTMHGEWRYFTVDSIDLKKEDNYIGIGTLESYRKIRDFYGEENVIPVYIEVDDGIRLERALKREQLPQNRKFAEMCRRFLTDTKDYSEENIQKAGINMRIQNDEDLESCMNKVMNWVILHMNKADDFKRGENDE